jgi:hypothetical protein
VRQFPFLSVVIAGFLTAGCSMAETVTPVSPIEALGGDYIKSAPASGNAKSVKSLDGQLLALVGKQYKVKSSQYYKVAKDIPWIAISKNVQNQMLEKSIQKADFPWEDPGITFVEIYPQGTGAFAVAMDDSTVDSPEKFISYFVLSAAT